ncbi:hypothetical protein F5884DRAFT_866736, partial [Xylogone sp. PMI_703]
LCLHIFPHECKIRVPCNLAPPYPVEEPALVQPGQVVESEDAPDKPISQITTAYSRCCNHNLAHHLLPVQTYAKDEESARRATPSTASGMQPEAGSIFTQVHLSCIATAIVRAIELVHDLRGAGCCGCAAARWSAPPRPRPPRRGKPLKHGSPWKTARPHANSRSNHSGYSNHLPTLLTPRSCSAAPPLSTYAYFLSLRAILPSIYPYLPFFHFLPAIAFLHYYFPSAFLVQGV